MSKSLKIVVAGATATGLGLGIWLYYSRLKEVAEEPKNNTAQQEKESADENQASEDHYAWGGSISSTPLKTIRKRKPQPKIIHQTERERQYPTPFRPSYQHLIGRNYEKVQVHIYNPTNQEQRITLWGANRQAKSKGTTSLRLEGDLQVQAMEWNPANQSLYLISQLSNTLTIINSERKFETQLLLEPSNYPGTNSPVDLAINTNSDSVHYGYVYVIGSVANTVSIFNREHQLIDTLETGIRPVSIAYHQSNRNFYILNLSDHTVSILNGDSHLLSASITTPEKNPITLSICEKYGDLYIGYLQSSKLSVFGENHTLKEYFEPPMDTAKKLIYDPLKSEIWAIDTQGQVTLINCENHESQKLEGMAIQSVHFSDSVISTLWKDGSIRIFDRSLNFLKNLNTKGNLLVNTKEEWIIFNVDTQSLQWAGIKTQRVEFDEDYAEHQEDFKYSPALVKHLKLSTNKGYEISTLQLEHKTATGKTQSTFISLNDYRSPQHFQNIYEVYGLEGSIIDGQTGWVLKLSSGQRITAIIHYRQLDIYKLLPEQSRKSIPII